MALRLSPSIFPLYSYSKLEVLLGIKRDRFKFIADKAGRYYRPFDKLIPGKKPRHIDNPVEPLKFLQKKINRRILRPVMLSLPNEMVGGIPGKSIKDNASFHTNQEMVVTLDLRDCYPNINNNKVNYVWLKLLAGFRNAALLTQLTSFQTRLPQGASTSLAICNLALLPMFEEIKSYCDSKSVNVSLYVDDITLSGKHDIVLNSMGKVINIIQKFGYKISSKKIRKMPASQKQKVNGVLVNKKISKAMDEIESIRTEIINLAKNKKSIYKNEVDSIMGKIQHVKQLSEKGGRLELFAQMLLEGADIKEAVFNKKDKIIKCNNTKKHNHYYI